MCSLTIECVLLLQVLGSIDPVIKSLLSAPDQEELTKMVDNLFLTLDADRGGSIRCDPFFCVIPSFV